MAEESNLVAVEDLTKTFTSRSFFRTTKREVQAVDGVSFQVKKGETLCLAGVSGSGKTTIARMIALLERPTNGTILYDGQEVRDLIGKKLKAYRRKVQMIFQDPYDSLNPRLTIAEILEEPIKINRLVNNQKETRDFVEGILQRVDLKPPMVFFDRFPHQLSGGERQRVLIASALLLSPDLLIADEPVSMLDVSIKAGIINLLEGIRKAEKLTYILITHDLSVARYLAERIIILYRGRIVEEAPTETLLNRPFHPYTEALLAAIPRIEPNRKRKRQSVDQVHVENVQNNGCIFLHRCPKRIGICEVKHPEMIDVGSRHRAACYLYASAGSKET
jgi:oligopeptide/dipeptide ABC transporter ATP-binding protein